MSKSKREIERDEYIKELKKKGYKEKKGKVDSLRLEFYNRLDNIETVESTVKSFLQKTKLSQYKINECLKAVSEVFLNEVIHAYEEPNGIIKLIINVTKDEVKIIVSDTGKGIENTNKVKEKFFTTRKDLGMSGLGFDFIDLYMDSVKVESILGLGTEVTMIKKR